MRFGDFVFPGEPEALTVTYRRRITQTELPGGDSAEDSGGLCRVVSGRGSFVGAGAAQQFAALQSAMEAGGAQVLQLPGAEPFWALARRLERTGCQHPHRVEYAFEFVEAFLRQKETIPRTVTAAPGETLWDIAWRYGKNVDDLVRANPQVPHIRKLQPGEMIFVARAGEDADGQCEADLL